MKPLFVRLRKAEKPFVGPIEEQTERNEDFRRVLFTGDHEQLVVMKLDGGEKLDTETHPHIDQFFRVEDGEAIFVLNGKRHRVGPDEAVVIPAGTKHEVINASPTKPLKVYTIYGPPNHPAGTVDKTKEDAERREGMSKAEGEFRGGDPEEIRLKREEKREEMEATGQMDEGEDEEEEVDDADREEAEQAEADKADMAASLGKATSVAIAGQQVSPVGTAEYIPKDKNGEPLNEPLRFRGDMEQPWVEVGPPRQGKNQEKPWSEVLGLPPAMAPAGPPIWRQALREQRREELGLTPRPGMAKAQEEAPGAAEEVDNSGSRTTVEVGRPALGSIQAARQLLDAVPQMSPEQLVQVSKVIWGDDYEYGDYADEDYIREDVIGSLMDVIEGHAAERDKEIEGSMSGDLRY